MAVEQEAGERNTGAGHDAEPAPVVEDMSAWLIAGRVVHRRRDAEHETDYRTPADGIEDGVEAERLGFRRVFLSERLDVKEAGAILGAIAGRTSRLEIGPGAVAAASRHPWHTAAFAATMQACFGPRFVLGLGLGEELIFRGSDMKKATYRGMADYVDIVRRLWAGETIAYDGPVGSFDALAFRERFQGPPPPVWLASFANPKGAKLIASSFDGVMLPSMFTPEATRKAVERIREECERIGRDPASVRVCQAVVTAPELDEPEMRSIVHGRAITYLQAPWYGDTLATANGWDLDRVERLRGHERFRGLADADQAFHRRELLEVAGVVPDEWMEDSCAIGSVEHCVQTLQRFREAGADEIGTYGSTPQQNAALLAAWRAAT